MSETDSIMDRTSGQGRAVSLLGLARRAGRLEAGYDSVRAALRSKKSFLAVAAGDISDKTWKNLCYEAQRAKTPCLRLNVGMEELGRACGVRAGILSVNDRGFARAVEEAAAKSGREHADEEKEEEIL